MRVRKAGGHLATVEIDMTPMIDVTFQLVAFFMMVLNFTQSDVNERIKLPSSELAKPPDAAILKPLTVQVTDDPRGTVIFGGEEMPIAALEQPLLREKQVMNMMQRGSYLDATVVIRADRDTKTGKVQEVIAVCQNQGFEKYVLRAKNERI